MTIPEAQPHIAALKSHLETQLSGVALVSVGEAPDGDPPYVVLYPDPGEVDSERLCDLRECLTLRVMMHAIGDGPEQATWAADKARAVLLGEPFTVEGRKIRRLTQTLAPPPIRRDDDPVPPLYLQVNEFEIRSDPA